MGLLGYDPYPAESEEYPAGSEDNSVDTSNLGVTDMGQYGGILGGSTKAGQLGSIAGRVTGISHLGTAADMASRVSDTGKLTSAAPSLARAALSEISRATNMPIGMAVSMLDNMARSVRQGMTPEDSFLGTLSNMGLRGLATALGAAAFGPIGALLGGVASGFVNISSITDGLTEAVNDWGMEAQATANLQSRKALQELGITKAIGIQDIEDFEAVERAMSFTETSDVDQAHRAATDMGDTYGQHGTGEGGFGAMSENDADATDTATGTSIGHGGLQGFGLLGTDADAAENEGYGVGHFGGAVEAGTGALGGGGESDGGSGGDGRGQGGERGGGRDNDGGGYR